MNTTPTSKTCPQCGRTFTWPIRNGYHVDRNRWMAKQFCNRTCANRYRKPYLRINIENDAEENGTLRSQCNQDREDQVKCIRNLHSGNEAKAQAEIKPLGALLRVKAPALHAERDMLFDKWLRAYDNYQAWKNKQVNTYCTNYSHDNHNKITIHGVLKRHLDELSEQLRTYDDRINAAKTTGALLY